MTQFLLSEITAIFPPIVDASVKEFVHVCEHYIGAPLKFVVNIGSSGAVTGAAIVYLQLIGGFQHSIGDYFYREY